MMGLAEFAFDTETNSLRAYGPNKDFKVVGISISWGKYNNYYIPLTHVREEDRGRQVPTRLVVKHLQDVFEREDVRLIGANIKFDMHVMSRIGITIKTADLWDVNIASWLCNENTPNGLKVNSNYFLGVDQTHFKEVTDSVPKEIKKAFGLKPASKATFDLVLIDEGAPYAIDDAFYTWELYLGFLDLLEKEGMDKIYERVYMPFIQTLFKMEECGVVINEERLEEMRVEIRKDIEDLLYSIYELAGVEFNPGSSAQLCELLFGYQPEIPFYKDVENFNYLDEKIQLKMQKDYEEKILKQQNSKLMEMSFRFSPISKTKKGAPQTNSDTVYKLAKQEFKNARKREGVELCKKLVDYKKLSKLNSAFIEGLKEQIYDDGKVHPSFNILGTDSGRLSCSSPNLQQLPKAEDDDKYQIRSLFMGSIDEVTGKRKKIIASDYSNLEMRVLAHFSEDERLITMFKNGDDAHGSTAVNMFELDCEPNEAKKKYPHLRQAAKVINFLLMYGGGAYTLFHSLKDDRYNPIDLGSREYLEEYGVKRGEDVAQIYIDKYFATYSGVAKFIKNQKRYAHKYGCVYTLLRRKRRLPDINSHDMEKVSYCERLAVNSSVQGSAADITMSAQNRIDAVEWFREHRVNMLIQVHDELVFECPEEYVEEAQELIGSLMSHPFGEGIELNLPITAEYDSGDTYQQAK